jgi:hypothetical protein
MIQPNGVSISPRINVECTQTPPNAFGQFYFSFKTFFKKSLICNKWDATTLSITTFSIITLSILTLSKTMERNQP